jgi:GntR family transcriptional regulator, transcriptional repressor for pyruvate dehydrogenase complex
VTRSEPTPAPQPTDNVPDVIVPNNANEGTVPSFAFATQGTVPSVALVSDRVFVTLLEALLGGRYAAGEKLPTQRALAADLGVTMSSVREALKRLEQMGLVDVRHGSAMRVRDWREHGGLDVLTHLLFRGGALDAGVLRAILEARALMLRELAGLAAQRRSDDQARRIQELAERFAGEEDPHDAARVDFAFFTEVAQAAGNLVFELILNAIRDLYFAHLDAVTVTARPAELAPVYARIARAIERGDGNRARAAAFELASAQAAQAAR